MNCETDVEAAPQWYLVQAKPRQAERAEVNLVLQGYSVFHPQIMVERIRRGRRVVVEESLFPNYLFIRLRRWVDNWYPLRSTRGVARLVSFGREPLPVQDAMIAEIRRRLDARPAQSELCSGQKVEIIEGPFRGLEAIFKVHQGERRAQLLIELLHRQITLTIPIADIRRSA
ncbi:MAG: transcription/translation regulatory transformer protein RfaH [Thiocapsa sp.]|uniref:transcription/translation regulatory transformer protein RfaH n=1 Tax=Thiocapsa sp. TaxID=2024551 RepID=UPI001BD069E3|nr:transcription/translation regulatory transformer protein RfaH [Thiocapsa sp.]QVL48619.1 MAG: transcription/translation regulatory transformer protein RfaH [Thiocapsa sp.]